MSDPKRTDRSTDRVMRPASRVARGILTALCLALSGHAGATLIDRGNGLVYDDDLDVLWAQFANLAAGSSFDDGASSTDGRMTQSSVAAWAADLVYGGFDDWRLPVTDRFDPTCSSHQNSRGFGSGCTGGEMGHLYYVESITASSQGPFFEIEPEYYWTNTFTFDNCPTCGIFDFNFGTGDTAAPAGFREHYAWAVRDGDVGTVSQGPTPEGPTGLPPEFPLVIAPVAAPEPATAMLLALGLAGLCARRRAR